MSVSPPLLLSATASLTEIECSWNLSGSLFQTVTRILLTYTDVGGQAWQTVAVSPDGPISYREVIYGLDKNTQYKLYLTVFGKKADGTTHLEVSAIQYATTTQGERRPFVSTLSGQTYLQVLFWADASNSVPFNFSGSGIAGGIISYTKTVGSTAGAPAAYTFGVNDVVTYNFSDGNGDPYTYKYVLVTGLTATSEYEVAISYYTNDDIGPISSTATVATSAREQSFAAYALNEVNSPNQTVNASSAITVRWRNPVVLVNDTYADIPSKQVGESWVTDVTYALDQTIDVTTTPVFSSGKYRGEGAGVFAYKEDTVGLVAGTLYRYAVSMRDVADTVTTVSRTNAVRALQTPTIALAPGNLKLNVTTGLISLDASFSDIFTNTGGFQLSDYDNSDFKLEYQLSGDGVWLTKRINVVNGRVASSVDRGASQVPIQFKITARAQNTTLYVATELASQSTAYSRAISESSTVGAFYNTTLPGSVTGFTYTNTTSSDVANKSITLTWSNTDSAINTFSNQFYHIVATRASDSTSKVCFLAANFSAISSYLTGYDLSDNFQLADGICSYTFTPTVDAFFATGESCLFTIRRVYINLNAISSTPVGTAGVGCELLHGPTAGASSNSLKIFANPHAPLLSSYAFNETTYTLSFNLAYSASAVAYGFNTADTYFRVILTDANANTVYDASDNIQATNPYTINMSGIGAVGDQFTLRVREYVTTKYLSNSDTNGVFYSSETTKSFRKEGPHESSDAVVSYKNTDETVPDGTHMKITWLPVTDAAAAALGARVYYLLNVIDETAVTTSPDFFLLPPDLCAVDKTVTTPGNMFSAGVLPALSAYDRYGLVHESLFAYIFTGCVLGHEYSYKVTARYYAPDFDKYVVSPSTFTARAMLAFNDPPSPLALIDVQSNGLNLNFDMAYGANNTSGIPNASLGFEYTEVNASSVPIGNLYALNVGENIVTIASLTTTINQGDIIPVAFNTYFNSIPNSSTTVTTKFSSSRISNLSGVNPPRYTYSPQIKTINVAYVGGECKISIIHEINGAAPSSVLAVTNSANVSNVLTLSTIYDPNSASAVTPAGPIGDFTYVITVPNVKVGGLAYATVTLFNSSGMVVANVENNSGLAAGNYRKGASGFIFV